MRIFSISDLHLSTNCSKPMDVFKGWENYVELIASNWQKTVKDDDVVLIGGDISWAMTFEEAEADLDFIGNLKGKKVMIKGNHDYWWKSITLMRQKLKDGMYALQNDSIKIENCIFCGTRGWNYMEQNPELQTHDKKIYEREIERLKLSLKSVKKIQQENDKVFALSHFPPFNTKLEDSPFTDLYNQYGVEIVIYGHVHRTKRYPLEYTKNNIKYYLTATDQIMHNVKFIYQN